MKFPASMRRLLRLRESLERQEEMKVALAAARVGAASFGLDAARRQSRGEQDALQAALREREAVDGAELQVSGLQREAEAERERQLRDHLARLESAHALQVEILLARRRERRTLDILEEHCRRAQRRQQERREQAALDEAFLLTRPPGGGSDH